MTERCKQYECLRQRLLEAMTDGDDEETRLAAFEADDLYFSLSAAEQAHCLRLGEALWECLTCARTCRLDESDFCPTCGHPLPEPEEVENS